MNNLRHRFIPKLLCQGVICVSAVPPSAAFAALTIRGDEWNVASANYLLKSTAIWLSECLRPVNSVDSSSVANLVGNQRFQVKNCELIGENLLLIYPG